MGDNSVDLSGDVGAVGRILLDAPDEDAAEPALLMTDPDASNNPDPIPSHPKRGAEAPAPSLHESADAQRLQPDNGAAKDLAGASSDLDHSSDASDCGAEDASDRSKGEVGNGERGGRRSERTSEPRKARAKAEDEGGVDHDPQKVLEDDEMHEDSEEYVVSEHESDEGSDEDFKGPVRKRKRMSVNETVKSTGAADAARDGQEDEESQERRRDFIVDLKGVMFSAALQPMPCTALVVHVGENQAKVHASYFPHTCMHACWSVCGACIRLVL
jgi:hypothetical protein